MCTHRKEGILQSQTHTHKHTHVIQSLVLEDLQILKPITLPTVLILPISYFNTYKCCCRFSILLLPFHWKWLMRRVSPFATTYWLFAHSTANSSHNKWNAAAVHMSWTDLMMAWKHLLRLQVLIHHGLKLLAFTAMAFSASDTSQTRYFLLMTANTNHVQNHKLQCIQSKFMLRQK